MALSKSHFIGGAFVAPAAGRHFETMNPANGGVLARVAQGDSTDIDIAVASARKAQESWAKLSGHARARHLYALARAVQRHARLFAVVEALDNGKPIRETRDIDVPQVARHFYYHAGWAQLQATEFADQIPVGVVGQIIPWNFPLLMLAWKVAPALALGNTVVLKPAEFTSLTALLFAEIAAAAGLPAGVLNVVTEDAVPLLPADPTVRQSTEQHYLVHLPPEESQRRVEDPELRHFIDLAHGRREFGLTMLRGMGDGTIRTVAIHGDTKLDNFLFSRETGRVKAMVDLDTIMPHTWLADWGGTRSGRS